ncbi:hypothetical protein [Modestobacter italicus]|uniref:hypothetical protein n=1 Tax=Modestobacter italicus (strain DSM 44449 / CECT 9708 / BC 501) TaxID=2732864 RepID=UPI001C957A2B|nr:hypothetical protein [Modestobacter italicus]
MARSSFATGREHGEAVSSAARDKAGAGAQVPDAEAAPEVVDAPPAGGPAAADAAHRGGNGNGNGGGLG